MNNFGRVVEYIDTVQFFFPQKHALKEVTDKLTYLKNRLIIKHLDNGTVMRVQQPNTDNFKVFEGHGAVLTRIDFAVDVESSNSHSCAINVSKTLKLKQTREKYRGHKKRVVRGNVVYYRKAKSKRNIVIYGERPSKVTGKECVHVELRLKGSDTISRHKVDLASIIAGEIDTKKLFRSIFKKVRITCRMSCNAGIIKILEDNGYVEMDKVYPKKRRLRKGWLEILTATNTVHQPTAP